jgi:hypothetical protein
MVSCTDWRYFIFCDSLTVLLLVLLTVGNKGWCPYCDFLCLDLCVVLHKRTCQSVQRLMVWGHTTCLCLSQNGFLVWVSAVIELSYRAYLYLLTLNSQFLITKFTKSAQHIHYLSYYLWCLDAGEQISVVGQQGYLAVTYCMVFWDKFPFIRNFL